LQSRAPAAVAACFSTNKRAAVLCALTIGVTFLQVTLWVGFPIFRTCSSNNADHSTVHRHIVGFGLLGTWALCSSSNQLLLNGLPPCVAGNEAQDKRYVITLKVCGSGVSEAVSRLYQAGTSAYTQLILPSRTMLYLTS
jgi:hypothetical protein